MDDITAKNAFGEWAEPELGDIVLAALMTAARWSSVGAEPVGPSTAIVPHVAPAPTVLDRLSHVDWPLVGSAGLAAGWGLATLFAGSKATAAVAAAAF